MENYLARRASAEVAFNGLDVTSSIEPWLLSLTYTDCEDDESDDLQIELQDRNGKWLKSWLEQAIDISAATDSADEGRSKLKISATIMRQNWNGAGTDKLPCGTFEMDSVTASGPPSVVTMKGAALPYSATIRQTVKSQAWESYTLKGIATEMASRAGLSCLYEAESNPSYSRLEQTKQSDIRFLKALCDDAGISLKCTDSQLVLFDQTKYEKLAAIRTYTYGDGKLQSWRLKTASASVQYASCRVRYTTSTGTRYEGIAYVEDYDEDSDTNQQLEVTARVSSNAEAKALAEKRLRLHNKYQRTAHLELAGDPGLVAGVAITLTDWGAWSGKYFVQKATHKLSKSGYFTTVEARRVLEGY